MRHEVILLSMSIPPSGRILMLPRCLISLAATAKHPGLSRPESGRGSAERVLTSGRSPMAKKRSWAHFDPVLGFLAIFH